MNLAVRIQHHPSRIVHLNLLTFLLDTHEYQVIYDSINPLSGCKKVLESLDEYSTHVLILQDDALPSKYLISSVKKLIELMPNEVISLYTHHTQATGDIQFLDIDYLHVTLGYVLPIEVAKAFLAFMPKLKSKIKEDDLALSTFLHLNNIRVMNTVPSLVDHLGWRDSTIAKVNRLERRVATNFIGIEKSGFDIDWDVTKTLSIKKDRRGHYLTKLNND